MYLCYIYNHKYILEKCFKQSPLTKAHQMKNDFPLVVRIKWTGEDLWNPETCEIKDGLGEQG